MASGWAVVRWPPFDFGADSFIEVAIALLVLWRLMDHADPKRERKASFGIGGLFLLLALGLAILIAKEGVGRVWAARSQDFTGGCGYGCGH